eukprot:2726245-Rhodomonas_salina.2
MGGEMGGREADRGVCDVCGWRAHRRGARLPLLSLLLLSPLASRLSPRVCALDWAAVRRAMWRGVVVVRCCAVLCVCVVL